MQRWPWQTTPHGSSAGTMQAVATGSRDLSAGWRALSSQFADVLALGGDSSTEVAGKVTLSPSLLAISRLSRQVACDVSTAASGDHAWVGRWFAVHDHCLLLGGRLDGSHRQDSTLVSVPRALCPPDTVTALEICMETLAMKPSEVRWRDGRPFVTLSAPNVAVCVPSAGSFSAVVSCSSAEGSEGSVGGGRVAIVVDVGSVWLRLTAVAPWRRERASEGGNAVAISVSQGLTVSPAEATLPALVQIAVAAGGRCEAPMVLTVSGGSVLTMCREIVLL